MTYHDDELPAADEAADDSVRRPAAAWLVMGEDGLLASLYPDDYPHPGEASSFQEELDRYERFEGRVERER